MFLTWRCTPRHPVNPAPVAYECTCSDKPIPFPTCRVSQRRTAQLIFHVLACYAIASQLVSGLIMVAVEYISRQSVYLAIKHLILYLDWKTNASHFMIKRYLGEVDYYKMSWLGNWCGLMMPEIDPFRTGVLEVQNNVIVYRLGCGKSYPTTDISTRRLFLEKIRENRVICF